jgi:AcrR family transcriptional regulator
VSSRSPKPKGLRERNKEDKLARIERAARYLFSKYGYEGTTTRKIATRAGIGIGTLFVYFPEKRDVLFHLFKSDVVKVKDDAFGALPDDGTLLDRLMAVFGRFFDYYEQDRSLSRVFIKEMGFMSDRDRPAMATFSTELTIALTKEIMRAQARGEVAADLQPLKAAVPIFAIYFASLVSWLGGMVPERDNALLFLRSNLEHLYRGLAARPSTPSA